MNAIDVLRNEYPGDVAWDLFVEVFRPNWHLWPEKELYQTKLGNEEFAAVLTASLGTNSCDWFEKPCGALDKKSPSDVLRNELNGVNVIRTLLMRMPR